MANDLKRVGLIFTEEGAVDFKKTLQDINLELNKNYNQFKLTQAQWDSSTKSTEKLKAQQEYLTNAYEIQQDKVATLKMQLADLENAEDKNTTAIKKKRNELTNAEIKLEDYNNKLKDIEKQLNNSGKKIEEFGTKIENAGGKIENAGKKVSAFSLATGTALVASAKSAIEFESAFTGVEKTVDGTEQQMAELKQGIRDMAKEIPSSTTEISAVAEAAGQLGIKTEDILSFTRVMIDLGNSTNLSAEEAASALAKFANITNMSAQDYSKLGATIVDLGNNFATTEADIVEMATRLAATGELAGLSQAQILALATAMSSVGIEAEAGGSAMSKLLKQIQVAVETGSDDLKDFAKVAGMSSSEFKKAFEQDAVKALSAFISGLNDTERNGKSAIVILEEMGLTEVRLSNTVLSLANASDVMTDAIDTASTAWEDNTALTNEANKRYNTLESKIKICINKLKDFAITIGNKLMPSIEKIVDKIGDFAEWLSSLSEEQVDFIVNIGLMVTAIGPLLTIFGKLTSTTGTIIKSIGTFTQAVGVVKGTVTTTSTAVNGLAGIIGGLTSPVGLAVTAVAALAGGLVYLATRQTEAQKKAQEFAEEMASSKTELEEYNASIDKTVNANLSEINSIGRLREELSTLVDGNGKVKEGYETRVAFILNELNNALGTEYKLNGNIVQSYKELQNEIDATIEKKKAEIILKGQEEKYSNAIQKESEAVENLKTAHDNLGMSLEEAEKKYDELIKKKEEYERAGDVANSDYLNTGTEIQNLKNLMNAYNDAESTVKQYTENRKTYEENYALFMGGKYNEISNTVKVATQDWTTSSLETIRSSITEQGKALDTYKQIYEETGNEVALQQQEQAKQNLTNLANELTERTSTIGILSAGEIAAWKTLGNSSFEEYKTALSQMDPTLQAEIQSLTGIIANDETMTDSTKYKAEQMTSGFKDRLRLSGYTEEEIQNITNAFNMDTTVQSEAGKLGRDASNSFKNNANGEQTGKNFLQGLLTGIRNGYIQKQIIDTANSLGDRVSSSAAKAKTSTSALPGHKTGLDYVPYDDYVARLHKGERVLTAKENKQLMNTEKAIKNNSNNSNIGAVTVDIDYDKMANAFLSALNSSEATNRIENVLNKILEKNGQQIVLNTGELVGATANLVDAELSNIKSRRERGS